MARFGADRVTLNTPILDLHAEIGDHHPGAVVTAGKMTFASAAR